MKITSLSLQGFRAFDEPFTLDLPGGKSLLLHGENGSGNQRGRSRKRLKAMRNL